MKDPASFVRTTAAFFLALSILCLLRDPVFLVAFYFITKMSPQFQEMMAQFGPTYVWMMNHMYIYYVVHFPVSLVGFTASLGALYKKTWSLALFPKVLVALILFHSTLFIYSIVFMFSVPDHISTGGVAFRGMMFFSQGMSLLFYLGLIAVYSWLWVSFRKKEVQSLFR